MTELTTTVQREHGRPFTLHYNSESDVQRGMADDIASGRLYEPGTWRTIEAILRPGDHFIDVGAHIGVFTMLAASIVGRQGFVLAYEPDTHNRTALLRHIAENKVTSWDVSSHAVSDTPGRIVFHRCADNDGGHAIYDPGLQKGNPKTRNQPKKRMVDATTLDHVNTGKYPMVVRPRLIKIDVEGAECAVLRGAQKLIATHRPAIIAEVNEIGLACMGETPNALRELVRQHGYREAAIQDTEPWLVSLTPEQSIDNRIVQDGQTFLNVYNLFFSPEEWPDITFEK